MQKQTEQVLEEKKSKGNRYYGTQKPAMDMDVDSKRTGPAGTVQRIQKSKTGNILVWPSQPVQMEPEPAYV